MSRSQTPTVPPHWNIILPRNLNFTGREDLLAKLHAALTSDCAAALTQTQAIHGLGGIGKTQIALEYAYRFAGEYNLVWWVHAEEPATLAGDFARLASELDLPEKDARDQSIIVQAVHHALRQRQNWLIIFDNAQNPDELHDFLPQGGHIIITSRHQAWRSVACPLPVETMERGEAIDFLLKRTGQTDRDVAGKLAQALGHLPLALEQAGAFVDERQISLSNYLALFSVRRRNLLQKNKPLDYPDTVATTWNLSFEQVERESVAASELMNLCAFFAPDDIALDLLKNGASHLTTALAQVVADGLELSDAMVPLLNFSLIAKAGETISVHRLVQAVARDRLSETERKRFAEVAAWIVYDAFPGDITTNPTSWNVCALLLPHALAVAGYASGLDAVPKATAGLFNQSAMYLKARAEFLNARQRFERALKIAEAAYGPDHPNVATMVNNLGSVLKDLGDWAGAKACFERALKIAEVASGPDHPNVAIVANNLGSVLDALGDWAGAKACLERALKIDEATYGPDHPNVARDVNNLGMVLKALGDWAGAKACFERALKIDEAAYGPDHPAVATTVNNLGMVLQALGDRAEAKACLERAVEILHRSLGDNHPYTQAARRNLESLGSDD